MGKTINERGCIDAGEEWLGRNVIVVAGVAVGIAFLQVIFLFLLFYESEQNQEYQRFFFVNNPYLHFISFCV